MVKIIGPVARRYGAEVHSYIPELAEQLRKGLVDRREFLRTATLLGMSAGAAYTLAGTLTGDGPVKAAMAETPKKGGVLRVSMAVQEAQDPAKYNWTEPSNVSRFVVEYLCRTGTDNITRPYLAEGWSASDDLKTWTFKLQKGVKWSNGDDFTSEDVAYNFKRWLDPALGSSNLGLFNGLTESYDTGQKNDDGSPKMGKRGRSDAVEVVDDHTIRLHLNAPELAIPENLYNYPTAIVHRKFDEMGADLIKNPVGTGAMTIAEYKIGEKAVLQRRDQPWWGGDFYLDGIEYIDHGNDPSAMVGAMASDQVDMIYQTEVSQLDILSKLPDVDIYDTPTAQTAVMRMQVDQKPFDNPKVRQAVAACLDAQKILDVAYRGKGLPGENHHVCQIHPEYFKLPALKQDHALAKKLLEEAGYKDGIELTVDVGDTTGAWETAAVQAFKEQCAPAGITLNINKMPANQYWEIWDKTPFGFTSWTHRPLGVQVLNLGYRSGVPWNESHYSNPEFDKALDHANGILDVNERKKAMEKVESILQGDAVVVVPLWRSVFKAAKKRVKGFKTHPTYYHQFESVWLDDA